MVKYLFDWGEGRGSLHHDVVLDAHCIYFVLIIIQQSTQTNNCEHIGVKIKNNSTK